MLSSVRAFDTTVSLRRLAWLTFARLTLYIVLLIVVATVYLGSNPTKYPFSVRVVLLTVATAFFVAAIYAVWLRTQKALRTLAWVQIIVDQCIWTALVYVSGGPLSGATTLYGLSCVWAATTLEVRGSIVAACIGCVFFLTLMIGLATHWIPHPWDQPPLSLQSTQWIYSSSIPLVAILVVTLLAGSLAKRLTTTSTQLAQADRQVKAAERLATLGRIATALAHEIRNPLGSISGSIDLLHESPALSIEERRLCEIIRHEANRLNALVDDMMNLARPRPPSFERINLAQIAQEVVQLARKSQGSHRHDVPVKYEGLTSAFIFADTSQIRQLIWNLIRNAVQATASASPVVVSIQQAPHSTNVFLEVIDHGSGIPPELRERVFDAFMTTRSQGVGIGLAVVQQIVDAHHTTIEIADTTGGGTTFRIRWKLQEQECS